MLLRRSCNDVRLTRADLPFGGYDTAAPVAEAIAMGGYGDRRVRLLMFPKEKIGCTRIVNSQHQHHRRRLRTVVEPTLISTIGLLWTLGAQSPPTVEHPLHAILDAPAPSQQR